MSNLLFRIVASITNVIRMTQRLLADNRFLRFLLAGGINTLFGFAVYSTAILFDAAVWIALLAGIIAGIFFNFLTTGGYAFRQLSPARFPRFVICYLIIYGINLTLINFLSIFFTDKILLQLALSFPIALASYLMLSKYVFLRKDK